MAVPITITADKELHISQFVIERGAEGALIDGESTVVQMDWAHHGADASGEAEGDTGKRRPRRRRRSRRQADNDEAPASAKDADSEATDADAVQTAGDESADTEGEPARKPRRRGRRGGRRNLRAQGGGAKRQALPIDLATEGSLDVVELNDCLPDYSVKRVIGQGGMGTVFLAEQDRPRRQQHEPAAEGAGCDRAQQHDDDDVA